jgi:tyrosinase
MARDPTHEINGGEMLRADSGFTRRSFLKGSMAVMGAAALPFGGAAQQGRAKYTRYNVTSEGGKKALASYARGIEKMLSLPAEHPQNWFRHAFIHLMDCPHGNWWFYVWHRGYLGYFEQTIRNLSGDPSFAIPYWDWTTLPQIPDPMFDGVLTPRDKAYEPYTGNFALFTSFIKPALTSYWNSLSPAQRNQLKNRGYLLFDNMWNEVTGFDPVQKVGISANMSWAINCGSRYLTRDNPKLDEKTAKDASPDIVYGGLMATDFYNPVPEQSFNSSKTPSHNTQPGKNTAFSVLEGMPHNKIHNYIGGYGYVDPGPYGNMTNNLSPLDPIFFLHHSNMDRLWDVWTRKQKCLGLPYLPSEADKDTFSKEPFLFYVNGEGKYVGDSKAGDYLNIEKFDYDYEPGFGEKIVECSSGGLKAKQPAPPVKGTVKGNAASANLPSDEIKRHLATQLGPSLVAEVTLPRPTGSEREFDVLVGAPPDVKEVNASSPYYAGTIAFFGNMMNMKGMPTEATFSVPLPKAPQAFHNFAAARIAPVEIRVVPSNGHGENPPALKAASVREFK